MSIQEALTTMFTDDPINWLKWAVVFAILIGGYAIAVPLYKKVSRGVSWERKRDIAKSRNHVIKAALADKHPSGEVSRYDWHATYRYTIDGEERQYTAFFKHPSTPPLYLYLYYVDDLNKLFSCEEYHYENHKGILLLPVIFSALDPGWHCPRPPGCRHVGILKSISDSQTLKRGLYHS